MEAGEYGLTRGTCFVTRRLEVVAITGLLWISWCVLGAVGFHFVRFFRTHTACCKYETACLIYLYQHYVPIPTNNWMPRYKCNYLVVDYQVICKGW